MSSEILSVLEYMEKEKGIPRADMIATIVNAIKRPTEKLDNWRAKVKGLVDAATIDLVPGQPGPDFNLVGAGLFGTELGAGITVLAKNDSSFHGSR